MTLITTPGVANADSYASLADATTYFTARGIAAWTGTDAVKEAALRRGTSYLDNQYRDRWRGVRASAAQSLAWPRVDSDGWPLYDADGFQIPYDSVPIQIQTAAMEAALLILGGVDLEPTLERGGGIKSIGKSVGPLRKDIVYQDGAPAVNRYIVIDGLLRGLVTSAPGARAGNIPLVRM